MPDGSAVIKYEGTAPSGGSSTATRPASRSWRHGPLVPVFGHRDGFGHSCTTTQAKNHLPLTWRSSRDDYLRPYGHLFPGNEEQAAGLVAGAFIAE